jgi:hypothetical protein
MGIINESTDRLRKNVDLMNKGEATHPVHAHMHVGTPPKAKMEDAGHAGTEMYKRFYGGKKP